MKFKYHTHISLQEDTVNTVSFLSFRVTGDRADLPMDGAESSWLASAVIGSLASILIVTIIVLLIIFRRRIMAKFFQPKNEGNVPYLHLVS